MTTEKAPSQVAQRASSVHRLPLLALALTFLLGMNACVKNPGKPLYGGWGLDHERLIEQVTSPTHTEEERKRNRSVIETREFGFWFDKDKSAKVYLISLGETEYGESRYEVLSATKELIVVEMSDPDGTSAVMEFKVEDEDRLVLHMDVPGAEPMPVKRISKEEFAEHVARVKAIKKSKELRTLKADAQNLLGAWILDRESTVLNRPAQERDAFAQFFQEVRFGFMFNEDGMAQRYAFIKTKGNVRKEAKYDLVEIGEYHIIANIYDESATIAGKSVGKGARQQAKLIFLEGDRLLYTLVAKEGQDQATLDSAALIFKRVTKEEFQLEYDWVEDTLVKEADAAE